MIFRYVNENMPTALIHPFVFGLTPSPEGAERPGQKASSYG